MVTVSDRANEYLVKHNIHDLMDDMAALVMDQRPANVEEFLLQWLEADGEAPPPSALASPTKKKSKRRASDSQSEEATALKSSARSLSLDGLTKLRKEGSTTEYWDAKTSSYVYKTKADDGLTESSSPPEGWTRKEKTKTRSQGEWTVYWMYKKNKAYYKSDSGAKTYKIAETPFANE
ncbi:hypothetical protein DIPPA_20483 [Diplonema papillatum]|nr:hypothetical protein DIPPA_20483 [Diplonema papillatum]